MCILTHEGMWGVPENHVHMLIWAVEGVEGAL